MRTKIMLILTLALSLSLVAALSTTSGDKDIRALFSEHVTLESNALIAGSYLGRIPTTPGESTSNTLVERAMPLAIGSYRYGLSATNAEGNTAYYATGIAAKAPITLTAPSETGHATQQNYNIEIRTASASVCTWRFFLQGGSGTSQPLVTTDNLKHTIPAFGRTYRLNEGETIPILIRCTSTNNQENTQLLFSTGWKEHAEYTASLWPPIMTRPDQKIELTVKSSHPSTCLLQSEKFLSPMTSENTRVHVFEDVSSQQTLPVADGDRYTVTCTGPGEETTVLPELFITQQFVGDDIIVERTHPTLPVSEEQTVVAIRTNKPATCANPFDGANTFASADGYSHFVTASADKGTVECAQDSASGELDIDLEQLIDTAKPTVAFANAPRVCANRVLVTLAGGDTTVEHVAIKAGNTMVVRHWQGADTAQYNIGGLFVQPGQTLQVWSIDAAGNIGDTHSVPATNSQYSQEQCEVLGITQDLTLLEPLNRSGAQAGFAMRIGSEFNSTCTWNGNAFSSSTGYTHTITDAHTTANMTRGAESIFTVSCQDAAQQTSTEEFIIGWDLSTPQLTLNASPQTLSNILKRTSTITAQSNHYVRCAIGGNPPAGMYARNHKYNVSIAPGEGSRTVVVTCENYAGKEVQSSVTINETFPANFLIELASPNVTANSRPDVSVVTTKLTTCTYAIADKTDVLESTDSIEHNARFPTLSQGANPFSVTCEETFGDEEKTANFSLFYDNVRPELTIDTRGITCGLDEMVIRGNITDNTGVRTINITVDGVTFTVEMLPATLENLNLTENESYKVDVLAVDFAGNERTTTKTLKATKNSYSECDHIPPVVKVNRAFETDGTHVTLECFDDQDGSGCKDRYSAATTDALNGSCPNRYSTYKWTDDKTFTFTEPGKLCIKAEDNNKNQVVLEEQITVKEFPATCSNKKQDAGETGIDCGGDCPACKGRTCTKDSDCTSGNVCSDEGVCVEAVHCSTNDDCAQGSICQENICVDIDQTCTTDTDCDSNEKCSDAKQCVQVIVCAKNDQCRSGTCSNKNVCEELPGCQRDSDCATGSCGNTGVCEVTSCSNNKQDTDETDVDCGFICASENSLCEAGKTCLTALDCASGVCNSASGVCAVSSCSDRVKNGDEQGVDCGGSCSAQCGDGGQCTFDADCESGYCQADGFCGPREEGPAGAAAGRDEPAGGQNSGAGNTAALLIIVLGILLAGGGAGYIYYEQQVVARTPARISAGSSIASTRTRPDGLGDKVAIGQSGPRVPDFSQSKLREEARAKRRAQREQGRAELLDEFDTQEPKGVQETEKTAQTLPVQKQQEQSTKRSSKASPVMATPPPLTHAKQAVKQSQSSTQKASAKTQEDPFARLSTLSEEHTQLYNETEPDALKELAQSLLEEERVEKHHVASILADKEARGELTQEDAKRLHDELKL